MISTLGLLLFVFVASLHSPAKATLTASRQCPPPGFDSARDFSLAEYSSQPWFVQKQNEISYQPADNLYCVRAEYVPIDPSDLSKGFYVRNYANQGRVNGPPTGTTGAGGNSRSLLALPDTKASGPTAASKLLVIPAFLKNLLPFNTWRAAAGPYWVVAVGPNYSWAIISGGSPSTPTDNGLCRTGSSLLPQSKQYFGGLWFFSRKPVDPEGTAEMERVARELGLDTSKMLKVEQEGCTYEGA